jgi:hypothetical protein
VKPLALIAAALAAGFLAVPETRAADPATTAAPEPASEIRREMLAEYQYTPPGTPAATLPTSLQSHAPPIFTFTTPPDVVKMDAFEVQETGTGGGPGAQLTRGDVAVPPPSVASKLGIGVHAKDIGKVRVFAVTFLYVPIMVGFAW